MAVNDNDKAMLVLLEQIQKKLSESHVLNGGWDILLARVESMDKRQEEVLSDLLEIKQTIYDPDTGLFARLGEVKHAHSDAQHDVDQALGELTQWKKTEETKTAKIDAALKAIEELKSWKASITRFVWIVIVPAMGSLFAKIAYDLISTHIQLK